MGTNFYFFTQSKTLKDDIDVAECKGLYCTDTPDFGYRMHIAKTSMGWLPLFQANNCVKSVKQLKSFYEKYDCKIYDEYETEYTWEEFDERVLQHNGGIDGVKPKTKVKHPKGKFFDDKMPDELPVSHFTYANGEYADHYFKDEEGYEFCPDEFS